MPEVIYLNGKIVPREQAVVPIDDRGFLFGDAVYDVLRSYEGRMWAFERHLRRLQYSLDGIDLHTITIDEIRRATQQAFTASGFPNAHIYIHITRGVAPRAHAYTRDLRPTVLVHIRDLIPMISPKVFDGVSAVTMPDQRWRRCDIKSTNLLPNILAHTTACDQGAYEAILVDADGCITEASSMSLFCVARGVLLTTPLGPDILPSITREFVIEIAQDEDLPLRKEHVPLERFQQADEIFFASTCHEVCPVTTLDGRPVGDGKVGAITKRLLEAYRERVKAGNDAPR